MTKIRVLFNVISVLDLDVIIPKIKSLGIESVTLFGSLRYKKLPDYYKRIGKEFKEVVVDLYHAPTFENMPNWEQALKKDGERIIAQLADAGINRYAWMIELNLYGMSFNPLVKKFVSSTKLQRNFNAFYELAHDVNSDAQVIVVPYPYGLMNLNCGIRGWKDWWIKHGEKLKFDLVSLNAHLGTWIAAPTNASVYKHLLNSIGFIKDRGYEVYYVEVGYPTTGIKPFIGWYGWGREKDQVSMLKTCYQAHKAMKVPWMQICEFIDPDPNKQTYEPFFGDRGENPKLFGFEVKEELHWGLLRTDMSEKLACNLIKKITKH